MWIGSFRVVPAALLCLSLSGCGLNAVRVETATSVASLSETVANQANDILADGQARRDKALVTLVASDPSCELSFPIFVYLPTNPSFSDPKVPLCADSERGKPQRGHKIEKLDLSPLGPDAMRPTVDLIAATAAYGDALSKIVERPKADISKTLSDALALAQRAHAVATALGAKGLPGLPSISDDQKNTATALIQMISDLAYEQRQVKDIEALFVKNAAKLGRYCREDAGPTCRSTGVYAQLAEQVEEWSSVVGEGASQQTLINLQRAYRRERNKLGFEGRVAFVTLIQEAGKEPDRVRQATALFKEALASLSDTNGDLGRQLFAPNDEDRKRAAEITRDRIMKAMSLVLKAAMAWKVI